MAILDAIPRPNRNAGSASEAFICCISRNPYRVCVSGAPANTVRIKGAALLFI